MALQLPNVHHPTAPCKVLVADDHPVYRLGVVSLIQRMAGFTVCAEAGNDLSAMAALEHHNPDLVVLDISLPDSGGLELTRRICADAPTTKVLILSHHEGPVMAAKAIRAGACGYLCKDDTLPELATALENVAHHEGYLSSQVRSHHLLHALLRHESPFESILAALSPREIEVFRCLGEGLTTPEIAQTLGRGVKTVETHRANIKRKLNLINAGETARLAREWRELRTDACIPN